MDMLKGLTYTLISFSIISCGNESGGLSTGVSLGGTGMPTSGGFQPPVNVEDLDKLSPQYILWSKGKIDQQCSDLNVSMQLMHPDTLEEVEINNGYPIEYDNNVNKNKFGIIITVQNNSSSNVYNFLENCQPALQLQDSQKELQSLNYGYECPNADAVTNLQPGKKLQYKYVLNLPEGDLSRKLIYKHIYSFKDSANFEERNICESSYLLILEQL